MVEPRALPKNRNEANNGMTLDLTGDLIEVIHA
jgi:hypothetical protein